LTFDGNNEKVFNNFCNNFGLQPNLVKEKLIVFLTLGNVVSKSLEGKIMYDDS